MNITPLAVALATALLGTSALAQNLVANPSFEAGIPGWTAFGPNVYFEVSNPPAIVPRTGNQLLKIYGQFLGGFNVSGIFQSIPAVPGERFTLDCWSRHFAFDPIAGTGGPNDNKAVMKMAFFDATNLEIGSAERRVLDGTSPTNTWIDNAPVAGTAPAGTVRVEVLLLFVQPLVGTGSAQFDDVEFTRNIPGSGVYPGTGEDLVLSSGVGGATATTGAGNEIKVAPGGSLLEFNVSSPGGTFNLFGFYLVGDLFATGSPPAPSPFLPNIWLNLPTHFVLVDGSPRPIAGQPLIGPNGGTSTFFRTPTGLAGTSVMIQGVVIDPIVANTIYAATNAHEIRFQ